jgi:hypothetical protein
MKANAHFVGVVDIYERKNQGVISGEDNEINKKSSIFTLFFCYYFEASSFIGFYHFVQPDIAHCVIIKGRRS